MLHRSTLSSQKNNCYEQASVHTHFDMDDFDCYAAVQQMACQQLLAVVLNREATGLPQVGTLLDVGCGTGNMLVALRRHFRFQQPYGIDLSTEMLAIAKTKIPDLQVMYASASHLRQLFLQPIADLMVLQFVFAYVAYEDLLSQVAHVVKDGGLLSIATTTANSFQRAHKATAHRLFTLIKYFFRIDCLAIGDSYRDWMPKNSATIIKAVEEQGFEVIGVETRRITITLTTWREAWDFLHNAGWFVDALQRFKVNKFVVYIGFYLMKLAFFCSGQRGPLQDEVEIVVLTARKNYPSALAAK